MAVMTLSRWKLAAFMVLALATRKRIRSVDVDVLSARTARSAIVTPKETA